MFALFIDWVHYVGRPQNSSDFTPGDGTSMVRSARFQTCVYAHESVYLNNPCRLYALLFPHSRLTRLLRAPLIQKERFSYICMRLKALSLMFFLQIYVFIRLYTMESVYLKGMLIKKHTYDYIRLYTFENASLEILKISNIRLYTNIYVCKRLFGSS